MLGLLYITLCIAIGWLICSYAFPNLAGLTGFDYNTNKIKLSPFMLLFPAWFITGVLTITWTVYITAYIFRTTHSPLAYANLIAMSAAAVIIILTVIRRLHNRKGNTGMSSNRNRSINGLFCVDRKVLQRELLLVAFITVLACILMWTTFFARGSRLYVGVTVFSDFSPHIGMIRSFSYGNNFPTSYSHYAGEDIRYHFMFQFLVGNLEYLGLRLDYAFNLPSILSFVAAFMLLYVLAVKLTGKMGAGILACLFFAFRSSKTLYTFLTKLEPGTGILKALNDNTAFISDTPHEDWGLWNLNVYCNQRHLALGLAVMFLVLIIFLEHPFDMYKRLRHESKEDYCISQNLAFMEKLWRKIKLLYFSKEGWCVADWKKPIAAGLFLGSLGFFHGAALIGCILVLFVVAIISSKRLEFLITAIITMILSFMQTGFFIKGSAVAPQFLFGFIAENRTLFGVFSYLERLLGVLPIVLLVAFCLEKGVSRWLILAFGAPLVFAFTISLTVDVTVNHKYIMMSCILLGIYAASLVMRLLEQKKHILNAISILLIVLLTSTGIYDFYTVLKKNTPDSAVVLNLESPLTEWINRESNSGDIFLTHEYALNQVVLGGAMLYEGWPYFPWSAGYDTQKRTEQVKAMYEADTPDELTELIFQNNIRFIIVDRDNRSSDYYSVHEDNISNTYICVYTEGQGEDRLSIYDTHKPINRQ